MNLEEISNSKDGLVDHARSDTMQHDHMANFDAYTMAEEEQKIREELEIEIERDLEEEIKDGICHLSLQLHRLYQHRKNKSKPPSSVNNSSTKPAGSNNDVSTQVNITIKKEGDCKIEIYESTPEVLKVRRRRSSRSKSKQGRNMVHDAKHLDWPKTLRPVAVTVDRKHQAAAKAATNKKDYCGNKRDFEASSLHGKLSGWKY